MDNADNAQKPASLDTGRLHRYLEGCLQFAKNVETAFADQKFDIVINSDHITLAAGYYAAKATGAKHIYDAIELPLLNTRSGEAFDKFEKYEVDLIYNYERDYIDACDGITVIGPSFRKWFSENHAVTNIQVVRNCRNYEQIPERSPIKQDLGLGCS